MRVQHNIASMNSYRNFGVNNSKLGKNLEKLSSGYAINRAGDDAAGLAVSEKMRAQITGLEAAVKNAKDGIGLIQTAEGALTEVHDMLNRMSYLAAQSANGTYTDSVDRSNLDLEFQQLASEISNIGEKSNFNNVSLLNSNLDITLRIGADGETLNVKLTGSMVITRANLSITTGVKISTAALASTALTNVKNAINTVSGIRAQLGAWQNRLEHTVNNLGVMKENITDAESRIRDTDVAEEMMKFTKNSIMNQASQAMLAQANQLPQGVLQLLQ